MCSDTIIKGEFVNSCGEEETKYPAILSPHPTKEGYVLVSIQGMPDMEAKIGDLLPPPEEPLPPGVTKAGPGSYTITLNRVNQA